MTDLVGAEVLRNGSIGPDDRAQQRQPPVAPPQQHAALRNPAGGVTMELSAIEATPSGSGDRSASPMSRRRMAPGVARAIPLALVVAIGAGALTALAVAAFERSSESSTASDDASASDDAVVGLPAVEATVGLTDDNKEAVMTLCWRVSSNTAHECRLSYLRDIGEYPHRVVSFRPLRVDAYEVSNAQYDDCVAAGDCAARDFDACRFYSIYRYELGQPVPEAMRADGHPAMCVTANQARAYCATRGMRLPSTDEWERIARSGDDRMQPWGRFWTPAILNWGERDMVGFPIPGRLDGAELTSAVDAYEDGRTDEGIYNLFGNVAEWVEPRPDDPEGHAGVRGGSYRDNTLDLRMTRHISRAGDQPRSDVGFRCVADSGPPNPPDGPR